MEQGTTAKLCEFGCGQPAPIAKWNDKRKGAVKGQPQRYIHGHRRHRRILFVQVSDRLVVNAEEAVADHEGTGRAVAPNRFNEA